ncbi:MAG: sugar ABC transporter permease [Leptolinea sp.]|jgi:multiple sugar transport system permease protein|nr:sugar ABC transporter permease [Leptolinea sp.]
MSEAELTTTQTQSYKKNRFSDKWYSMILVSPAMVVLIFFGLVPLFYAIYLSFHYADLTAGGIQGWVGLDNFRDALNNDEFWSAAGRTLEFTIFAVGIEMIFGIALAFMINQLKWFKGIIRALFLLPMASAPAAVGLVWRYLYDPDFGVYTWLMNLIPGVKAPNWLGDPKWAMPSIIVFDIWMWTPYVMLIVLAGLQSLPREPFEAAELDGASIWMVLRRLTFPMLTPVLTLIFVLRTIDSIKLYDAVITLTRGGPGVATETVTYYLYRLGLKYFRLDQASAMALLVLFVVVIFSGVVLRSMMKSQAARTRGD